MTGDVCTLPTTTMGGGNLTGCVYGANTCYCTRANTGGPPGGGAGGAAAGSGGAPAAGTGTLRCGATPVPPTDCASDKAATGDACTASCLLPNNGGLCRCTMGALVCPPPAC